MVFAVKYYGPGEDSEIPCSLFLNFEDHTNILNFESEKWTMQVILKDIVDFEDFNDLLTKKEKKVDLYCYMKKSDKEYKGKRKIVWRGDNLAVSQGGIRIEFDKVVQEKMLESIKIIKTRSGY